MKCIKKSKVILTVYKNLDKTSSSSSKLVNIFDVVDYIVHFYKTNKTPLNKKRLYALIYLYQISTFTNSLFPRIDDVIMIENKGKANEELVIADVKRKVARFSDNDDLSKKIKVAKSSIYLTNMRESTSIEKRLKEILTFSLNIPLEKITQKIRENPPYSTSDKKGIINFTKNPFMFNKLVKENVIKDLSPSSVLSYFLK